MQMAKLKNFYLKEERHMKWLSGKSKQHRGLSLGVVLALVLMLTGPVAAQEKMNISFGGSTPAA